MNAKDVKIVFLGTPEFAVASLKALVEHGFNIVAVVTAPDRPSGRGMHIHHSAVKQYAIKNHLRVLQPEKLRDETFIKEITSLKPDLQLVVAFRMLPEIVWNMPPLGTINLHASLLPDYRGAAPINWAIINGEKETGLTTFQLNKEIDTGEILLQEKVSILPDDNAGSLHNKMMHTGSELLIRTVGELVAGNLQPKLQPAENAKIAPKLFTEDCRLNFHDSVQNVHNKVRGLSPFPTAFTYLNNLKLKIFESRAEVVNHNDVPGKYVTDEKTFLRYSCTNGYLYVKELQLEGKRKMKVEEFLRGYRF